MMLETGKDYTPLELQLLQNIRESFNFHLICNATFLAERLFAERDSEETRLILAECYFAEAKHSMVLQLLRNCQSQACKYLLALAAIKLNKKELVETILLRDQTGSTTPSAVATNSYALFLLGESYERDGKENEAILYYKQAFEKNPCLWVAYERICKLGTHKDASIDKNPTYFKESLKKSKELEAPMAVFNTVYERERSKALNRPESQEHSLDSLKNFGKSPLTKKAPIIGGQSKDKDKRDIPTSVSAGQSGQKEVLALLQAIAIPYQEMMKFNSKKAIESFRNLTRKQLNTGWVLVNIGRCYMDFGENEKAEEAFQEAFKREPYRVKGVEYFSSCLWQLKKQKELCELAFNVIEHNQFAPEAWIALGNCYSLQRDHESALNYFTRAIQLDPRFSYAHCLKGHEYIYCDQFAKAKNCYEMALKTDQNNFHAWWGLGNVYLKQEKYDKALENFIRANTLNSKNSVIYSYIGIVYEKMEKFQEALSAFKKGEELNPKTLLTRYHKTQIYYKMGDYNSALIELENLMNQSPKESTLYILIGNVHRKLGNNTKALQYYQSAQDLENKESQRVKNLIDSLTNNNSFSNYDNEL
jgi:anaphase-promoting complex subunit 3